MQPHGGIITACGCIGRIASSGGQVLRKLHLRRQISNDDDDAQHPYGSPTPPEPSNRLLLPDKPPQTLWEIPGATVSLGDRARSRPLSQNSSAPSRRSFVENSASPGLSPSHHPGEGPKPSESSRAIPTSCQDRDDDWGAVQSCWCSLFGRGWTRNNVSARSLHLAVPVKKVATTCHIPVLHFGPRRPSVPSSGPLLLRSRRPGSRTSAQNGGGRGRKQPGYRRCGRTGSSST